MGLDVRFEHALKILEGQISFGDMQKVCLLKIPEFWPFPSPLFVFEQPSPSPQGTFVLARSHPLHLNFYITEINNGY